MNINLHNPLWLADDERQGKIYTKWAFSESQLFHVHFYQKSKRRLYYLNYPIVTKDNTCLLCLNKPNKIQQFQIDLLCKQIRKNSWLVGFPGRAEAVVNGREIRIHLNFNKEYFIFDAYDSHRWDGRYFYRSLNKNNLLSEKGLLYRDLSLYRDFLSHYGADERWFAKKIEIPPNKFIV